MATGTRLSLGACAALALAAHAVVIGLAGLTLKGHPTAMAERATPMETRLLGAQLDGPKASSVSDVDATPNEPQAAEEQPPPAPARAGQSDDDDAPHGGPQLPPTLAAAEEPLPIPDAVLPADGVELRALVEIAADGTTFGVYVQGGLHPVATAKSLQLGLLSRRLLPDDARGPEQYCLLARYRPDAQSAELNWLPGRTADLSSCARKPAELAREIGRR